MTMHQRSREQERRSPGGPAAGLCIAIGLLGVCSGAAGQNQLIIDHQRVFAKVERNRGDDPEAPARLERIIADLASTDAPTRIAADRALTDDPGITLRMIEQALQSGGDRLSMDTRARLSSAARVRFGDTPRAAMGIQFWQNSNLRDRVVIERTFPKFDASTKIEDGDMVIEIDGHKIAGPSARNRFQAVIVSHDPGDVVPVTLRRGDQRIEVDIRLGRRDDLDNNNVVFPDVLDRAWRVRSASYIAPPAEPIKAPIRAEEWSPNPPGGLRMDTAAARAKGVVGLGPSIAGGGMPRGAMFDPDEAGNRFAVRGGGGGVGFRRNGNVLIFNNGMVWAGGGDPFTEPNVPPMTLQQELAELVRARRQSGAALEQPARPDARRALPDGQVVVLRDFVEKESRMLDKQIAAIRAEMAEAGMPPASEAAGHDADQPPPANP